MRTMATTKMTSKGQVVIPEAVRRELGLEPGARFMVLGEGDLVVLQVLKPPTRAQCDALIQRARQQVVEAGLTADDLAEAVRHARRAT